ncbi:octopamine receptor 1-like [Copidosoma floridanum]|uniref:octopamine receptor 1-like n=1 Tax=Copidosoma floridanum TaxID=29053 RepID=UPI0006C961CA|nr:octopamine receptor 1-like [Copidosoma floridanum]
MFKLIAIIALAVVIIVLNGATIIAGWLFPRLFRASSNHLVLSLAFSDLGVGLATLHRLAELFDPSFNDQKYLCILRHVFSCGTFSVSGLNILSIAADRYIAIKYPIRYPRYVTKGVINIVAIGNWCVAFLISSVPLYWNVYGSTETQKCEFLNVLPRMYFNVILVPTFVITLSILFLFNCLIWRETRAHLRMSQERMQELGLDGKCNSSKNNQVVLLVLGCFTLCWFPYLALSFIVLFAGLTGPLNPIKEIAFFVCISNSAFNPCIYAWSNPNIRKAFRTSIGRRASAQDE